MKATDQTVTITLPRDLVERLMIHLGDHGEQLAERMEAYAGCDTEDILREELRDVDAFMDAVTQQTN